MSDTIRIRSIKTKLPHVVTTEDWEKMKEQGRASKYIVVTGSTQSASTPEAVKGSDYRGLIKSAKDAVESENYAEALEAYTKAQEIKTSAHLTKEIAKIEKLIAKAKDAD